MTGRRVWELDALRGVCMLGMMGVHFVYDLSALSPIPFVASPLFHLISDWGGCLFVLLSGVCVTLGSKSLRRGTLVFLAGMLCTAVTFGMYRLGMVGRGMVIRFGVLHCLGCCMLLWPLFRRLPVSALTGLGIPLTLAGVYLARYPLVSTCRWLFPLGILHEGFASGDYFPLLPFLGFFLLGAALGKTVYREKRSLFPGVDTGKKLPRLFCFPGRHSLPLYLLHQPLITGVLLLVTRISN